MGPGMTGQFADFFNEAGEQQCQNCHAPLAEQSPLVKDSAGETVQNPAYSDSLRYRGLVCAACHVRGNMRYGPPRQADGSLTPSPEGAPHGGVTRTTYFEDSRFCAGCHQFREGMNAPNGKLLENTYNEWAESRYAQDGIMCQSCHMPDRQHLWRGIHDSTMTANGVTIEFARAGADLNLTVTNTGTGHLFPTYATPDVIVRIELLDENRQPLGGAGTEMSIARKIQSQSGRFVELSDTRLAPDSSATLTLEVTGSRVAYARGTVVVHPDAFYHNMFTGLLSGRRGSESRRLLTQAVERAANSHFTIFDTTLAVR